MAYVQTEHVIRWFKRHPGYHRTDQQGTRIVCPTGKENGYPAAVLPSRPSHITKCPLCRVHLGHVQKIPDDRDHQGEWQWPSAA